MGDEPRPAMPDDQDPGQTPEEVPPPEETEEPSASDTVIEGPEPREAPDEPVEEPPAPSETRLEELSPEARKEARLLEVERQRRKRMWIALGVVVLLLVIAGLIALILFQSKNQNIYKEAVQSYEAQQYIKAYRKLLEIELGGVGVGEANIEELKAKIIGDLLSFAEGAMNEKKWAEADKILASILNLEPMNPKANVMKFQELPNRKYYTEAEELYAQKKFVAAYDKLKKWIKPGEVGVGKEKKDAFMLKILNDMLAIVSKAIQEKDWDLAFDFTDRILSKEVEPHNLEARRFKKELPNLKTYDEAEALYAQKKYVEAYQKLVVCGDEGVGRPRIDDLKKKIIDDLMAMVREALQVKDWTRAIEVGTTILSLEPENYDAKALIKEAELYDTRLWGERKSIEAHASPVYSVAYSPDETLFASASLDRTVKIYDGFFDKEKATLSGHADQVWCVAFRPDSQRIATGDKEGVIKLWNIADGKEVKSWKGHAKEVSSLAFTPNGTHLASTSWDHTVRIWEVESGKKVAELTAHTHYVNCVAFSPDGSLMATGSNDKTIKLWNVSDWSEKTTLGGDGGHTQMVAAVAFHPDGKILASGSKDLKIKLWDVSSGKAVSTLAGHTDVVYALAFSADRKQMVSASWDETLRFWDVTTPSKPQPLKTFTGHKDDIMSVAFRSNGKAVITGSRDKTVRIWGFKE